jgi:hypothetical protein
VRIDPVAGCGHTPWGFTPHPWELVNRHWYLGADGPDEPNRAYTFLVVGPALQPVRAKIDAYLGRPVEEVAVNGKAVLVYGPGGRLADTPRWDFGFYSLCATGRVGETIRYPARSLQPDPGTGAADGSRSGTVGKEAWLIGGPWVRLRPGAYRVALRYAAAADGAAVWAVHVQQPDEKTDDRVHHGPLPAGSEAAVEVPVPADGRPRFLHASVFYPGKVPFTVRELVVERVR